MYRALSLSPKRWLEVVEIDGEMMKSSDVIFWTLKIIGAHMLPLIFPQM
jgi:hypothetical protein